MVVVGMKHIVCFSGGHSSAIAAVEVVRKFGAEDTILLNHDLCPRTEDADIKRFKKQVSDYLDVPITYANMPAEQIKLPYFRIKVLELLLYLDALELPKDAEKPYFYKSQVEKVKAIHRLLTGELERHYTIAELSERFSVPRAKRDGLHITHRNGVKLDCELRNLVAVKPGQAGRKYHGRPHKRPVIRLDLHGNEVIYPSVTDAARKNSLSISAMDRRLYHGVLDPRGYRFELLNQRRKRKEKTA